MVAERFGQVMPLGWGWGLRMSSPSESFGRLNRLTGQVCRLYLTVHPWEIDPAFRRGCVYPPGFALHTISGCQGSAQRLTEILRRGDFGALSDLDAVRAPRPTRIGRALRRTLFESFMARPFPAGSLLLLGAGAVCDRGALRWAGACRRLPRLAVQEQASAPVAAELAQGTACPSPCWRGWPRTSRPTSGCSTRGRRCPRRKTPVWLAVKGQRPWRVWTPGERCCRRPVPSWRRDRCRRNRPRRAGRSGSQRLPCVLPPRRSGRREKGSDCRRRCPPRPFGRTLYRGARALPGPAGLPGTADLASATAALQRWIPARRSRSSTWMPGMSGGGASTPDRLRAAVARHGSLLHALEAVAVAAVRARRLAPSAR